MVLNIIIWKLEANLQDLNCTGIYLNANNFTDNFGCANAIGNVAFSCEAAIINRYHSSIAEFSNYYTGYTQASNQNWATDDYTRINVTYYLAQQSLAKD